MKSGSCAINSIWNTSLTLHTHITFSPFSLLLSARFICYRIWHLLWRKQGPTNTRCAVKQSENMSAQKLRKGGPDLTVRCPSRRLFLSQHWHRAGSVLHMHNVVTHVLMWNLAANERGNVIKAEVWATEMEGSWASVSETQHLLACTWWTESDFSGATSYHIKKTDACLWALLSLPCRSAHPSPGCCNLHRKSQHEGIFQLEVIPHHNSPPHTQTQEGRAVERVGWQGVDNELTMSGFSPPMSLWRCSRLVAEQNGHRRSTDTIKLCSNTKRFLCACLLNQMDRVYCNCLRIHHTEITTELFVKIHQADW